jgi:hypothetical protein
VYVPTPEGRTENSPGLEAWEGLRKENRPESTSSPPRGRFSASVFRKDCLTRAADFRALFSRDNLRQKRLDGISETTTLFWYKNLPVQFRAKKTAPIKCNDNKSLRCRPRPCSAALVRRSFRNADGEKRPRRGLEVLSGRFSGRRLPSPESIRAWAVLFSPFGRWRNVQTARDSKGLS